MYFIAAGQVSQNRYKSLEKSFRLEELERYLPEHVLNKLKKSIQGDKKVYLWGANEGSIKQLRQVKENEYVVDVKNKEVMYVFRFCFYYRTNDTRLQSFIGWDQEKPVHERRPYHFVYFLKERQIPIHKDKSYFGRAFGVNNPNWLVGQRYFVDNEVKNALHRTNSKSMEELLGVTERFTKKEKPHKQKRKVTPARNVNVHNQKSNISRVGNKVEETVPKFDAHKITYYPASRRKPLTFWQWLKSLFGF